MTDFVVTITDPAQLAGITWAREAHNASLPPPPDPVEGEEPAPPATIDTDAAYVQWVMEQAAASYATQEEQAAWIQAYNDAQATVAGGARAVTPPSFIRR